MFYKLFMPDFSFNSLYKIKRTSANGMCYHICLILQISPKILSAMRVVTEYFEHGFYIILRLACPLLVFLKGNEKGNEVFDKP